jgi:ABC-2 type transport system permease protein
MITDSAIVAARILTELRRSRHVLALWIIFPAAMLVIFGWVRADDMGLGPAFTTTAPGILIGAGFFFSCLGGPVSVLVAERERRTMRRLLVSPLSGYAYFLGLVLAQLVVAAVQVALVYAITWAAGGRFAGSPFLGASVIVLSVLGYVGLGFTFGARVARAPEDVNGAIAGIGVPLLVLGGTFFSTDDLPPVLHALAQADPIFHMNEAFKAIARDGAGFLELWPSLALLAALAFICILLGARSYSRMLDVARSS